MKKQTIKEKREKAGQHYSITDLFMDLKNKWSKQGGGFFDWLKLEHEEKAKAAK